MRHQRDPHHRVMSFLIQRINEINEWRQRAMGHAVHRHQVEAIDLRVLQLREATEKGHTVTQ